MSDFEKRSADLSAHICQEMEKQPDHLLSFADYMSLALYHPTDGYYCSPTMRLGAQGDFTTAPEISPLFGRCIANQLIELMEQTGVDTLYEIGAGSGKLAFDILIALDKTGCLPKQYVICEISPSLKNQQQSFLQQHCPALLGRIQWITHMPASYQGIVIANEVFDALPVSLFSIDAENISERCVGFSENKFIWASSQTKNPALIEQAAWLQKEYDLYPGYHSEIHTSLPLFLAPLANHLTKGAILLIDYGYGQREYYHPQRRNGSLTCFYQHHRHDNPLLHPGLQDITAHVDFTRVIEIAFESGCELMGFTTQSAFLLASGLMTEAAQLEQQTSIAAQMELHQAIKLLTLPTEMGERVKVMALSKGYDLSLSGFTFQDRRRDL